MHTNSANAGIASAHDATVAREARSGPTPQTRETYVVTNNHFRGQAVVNAVEIKADENADLLIVDVPMN